MFAKVIKWIFWCKCTAKIQIILSLKFLLSLCTFLAIIEIWNTTDVRWINFAWKLMPAVSTFLEVILKFDFSNQPLILLPLNVNFQLSELCFWDMRTKLKKEICYIFMWMFVYIHPSNKNYKISFSFSKVE